MYHVIFVEGLFIIVQWEENEDTIKPSIEINRA